MSSSNKLNLYVPGLGIIQNRGIEVIRPERLSRRAGYIPNSLRVKGGTKGAVFVDVDATARGAGACATLTNIDFNRLRSDEPSGGSLHLPSTGPINISVVGGESAIGGAIGISGSATTPCDMRTSVFSFASHSR